MGHAWLRLGNPIQAFCAGYVFRKGLVERLDEPQQPHRLLFGGRPWASQRRTTPPHKGATEKLLEVRS
jgi:hypothetical protein